MVFVFVLFHRNNKNLARGEVRVAALFFRIEREREREGRRKTTGKTIRFFDDAFEENVKRLEERQRYARHVPRVDRMVRQVHRGAVSASR